MKVSFIVEGGSGPGNRRSVPLPSLALLFAPLRATQISRSPKEPARAWEGLNVAPAPSLGILQGDGGEKGWAMSTTLMRAQSVTQSGCDSSKWLRGNKLKIFSINFLFS